MSPDQGPARFRYLQYVCWCTTHDDVGELEVQGALSEVGLTSSRSTWLVTQEAKIEQLSLPLKRDL